MKRITAINIGGGGGGGHYGPPVGFSYAASKKVCSGEMKLSDF